MTIELRRKAYILCTKDLREEDGFVMLPLYILISTGSNGLAHARARY